MPLVSTLPSYSCTSMSRSELLTASCLIAFCLAGPRAGLWAIIPFQLIVMIGLGKLVASGLNKCMNDFTDHRSQVAK